MKGRLRGGLGVGHSDKFINCATHKISTIWQKSYEFVRMKSYEFIRISHHENMTELP